ncbi:hypothetical protein J3F84DRAFT_233712 [Trichoderma pleuroticola]
MHDAIRSNAQVARRRQSGLVSRAVGSAQPGFNWCSRSSTGRLEFRSWRHGESLLSVLRGCRGKSKGYESAAVTGGFECSSDAQGRFASAERRGFATTRERIEVGLDNLANLQLGDLLGARGSVQRRERGEGAGEEPLLPTNQNIDDWSVNGMPMTAREILAQCM